MNETANRIKELRNRKGYSQEELAERSGLTSRTIQRIENGETEPRGDSLARLAEALGVTVDDLVDWDLVEDNRAMMAMNLSALSFLVNPLLGILVPMMIWLFKKERVKGMNRASRELLNFQITWVIVFYVCTAFAGWIVAQSVSHTFSSLPSVIVGDFDPVGMVKRKKALLSIVKYLLWGYNLLMIVVNSVRANRGEKVVYRPAFKFLGK